ncbi:hypothetical protein B0H14DRAFT_25193 [Mycena olivaceomarginata]|nr:hypothetical protein B0H14DRAFT_25193 [Mycena olivaceomarginata]
MASPNPRLPAELTDHVIQDLRSEPEALASCALVCRSWTPAAQRIILSKISIHERNCAEIIEHLTSATPNIAPYVTRLSVYLWGDLRKIINRSTANLTPLLHLILPHISHFTHVTELVLDGCRAFHDLQWDEIWTDLLAAAFPSLSKLTVHYLTFEDLPDLVDLVSSFPQLTHLTAVDLDIADTYSTDEQEPYEGSKIPPPRLEIITYCSGASPASGGGSFLLWLAAEPRAFTALYLDLSAEAGDVNAGVELIGAAGSNLKTLSLSFDDQWHLWEGLDLSANSSLSSIGFKNVSDLGSGLVDILGSVASPLKRLSLGEVQHMEEDTWPGLIDALMSPVFTSLAQVNFFVGSSEKSADELKGDMSTKYPNFMARGIAVFEFKPYHEWDDNEL